MNKLSDTRTIFLPLFLQIFRFGIVGLTAAAIHISIVILLVQYEGLEPLAANIFGFAIAFQMSYWGNRLWTFSDAAVLHRVALPKLLLVQIVNFLANESLFYVFLTLHLPYPIALFLVLTILPVFTFISSKLWVFR
ncbi:GtrA family protein [Aquicella lusitana]|uniref:Putative flippase GtrA n=1 Tax=Aquicella lusitana TaxID=254246 RepID=A0A370GG90_9COXI|nr:GtrA family protein [Aquicella lusitana]RDI40983.1 putative flippase GtrA [Aquicella lusitana]VVC73612.1 hypothetical protein AQULUS_13590 [Aquicella lusitana]